MIFHRVLRHSLANEFYNRLPRYRDLKAKFEKASASNPDAPADYVHHPLSRFPRGSFWHLIHGYSDDAIPTAPMKYTTDEGLAGDRQIIERLCAYYAHCVSLTPSAEWTAAGMWDEILGHQFAALKAAVTNRDYSAASTRLLSAFRSEETDGMGQGSQMFSAAKNPLVGAILANATNSMTLDRLTMAAVAMGALPMENPEQGRYGENFKVPLADVVAAIEAILGYSIIRQPLMGLFGVSHGGGIIDARVPDDVYTSQRIRELAPSLSAPVAEIGGGFGGCAEYSVRAGLQNYTIYDLPLVGLIQGFHLCRSLSPDSVWFEGEAPSATAKIKIRPFFNFDATAHRVFSNRDSFPEMPEQTTLAYLKSIAKAERGTILLSINQEAGANAWSAGTNQTNTAALARESGLERQSRSPYWLRKGYVEEIFSPAQ
jgi:hypothetical protein